MGGKLGLAVVAIFLTLYAIAIPILGYLGYSNFLEIESRATNSVKTVEGYANEANRLVEEIKGYRNESKKLLRNITSEDIDNKPENAKRAVKEAKRDPGATLIERIIIEAISLQEKEKLEEAIVKMASNCFVC